MKHLKIISGANNERIFSKLQRIPSEFKSGIHSGYIDTAKYLKATVKKDLNDEKHGKEYLKRLGGRLVRHRASAPGEPPASFTGALEASIETKASGESELRLSAGGGKVDYAGELEKGGGGVAKRPYLSKAIKDNERNTIEAFYRNISNKVSR